MVEADSSSRLVRADVDPEVGRLTPASERTANQMLPPMLSLGAIFYPLIDAVAFQIGPVAVRWYGLAYIAGFMLAYAVLRTMVRRSVLRLTIEDLSDLFG